MAFIILQHFRNDEDSQNIIHSFNKINNTINNINNKINNIDRVALIIVKVILV